MDDCGVEMIKLCQDSERNDSYKNDETEALDSMLFIDILRKDIIKVDAKNDDNLRI